MINGRKSAKTGTLAEAARGQQPETPHRLEGENRNLRGPLAIFANRGNNEQSKLRSTAHRAEADLFTSGRLFSPWVLSRYRPCFLGIPPRRTLKHDTVFRSSLFSDSQIPWHRLRHELSRHGSHQKARSHLWISGGRDKTRFIRFGRTLSLSLGATLIRSGQ